VTTTSSAVQTARTPGRMAGRRGGGSNGPQPYDFRRPIKLSREHIRMLQIVFETYARSCGTLLTTRLRAVSTLSLLAIEQVTYDEYISTLSSPTVIGSVTLAPLSGQVLMEVPLGSMMASLDHMLGGSGGNQPTRPLTDVEIPLVRNLMEKMLAELGYGLQQLVPTTPRLGGLEYNPQFVRAVSPGDAVVVASFEIRVGDTENLASICLPFTTIMPVLRSDNDDVKLSDEEHAVRRNAHQKITDGLSAAPIEVAVKFRPARMRTDEIIDLQPGDVVRLHHPVAEPLAVTVNDKTFAHAVPGNQGSRLACLVVPEPHEENH
jgi:flagellar motor switch protein FliM